MHAGRPGALEASPHPIGVDRNGSVPIAAHRDPAGEAIADAAVRRGEHHVLVRLREPPYRPVEVERAFRPVHVPQARRSRLAAGRQPHGGQVRSEAGQGIADQGPANRLAHPDHHRVGAPDENRLRTHDVVDPLFAFEVPRAVFRRGLDGEVHVIDHAVREPPRDVAVVTDDDARDAGKGEADRVVVRGIGVQDGQVPDGGGPEGKVHVVGEDRGAGRRAPTGDHPRVRCGSRRHRLQNVQGLPAGTGVDRGPGDFFRGRQRFTAFRRRCPNAGRQLDGTIEDRGAPRWIRQGKQGRLPGLQVTPGPEAGQVPSEVGEVQVHDHPDGQRGDGIPGLRPEAEQRELGGERLVNVVEAGVHPGRVGLQPLQLLRLEARTGPFGGPPQVEGPQEAVRLDEVLPEQLGQSSRRHPPEELHLPHAIGGVQVAEGAQKVAGRARPHVRDAEGIRHDFHGLAEAVDPHRSPIAGGRRGEPEPADGDDETRYAQEGAEDDGEPAEGPGTPHSRPGSDPSGDSVVPRSGPSSCSSASANVWKRDW